MTALNLWLHDRPAYERMQNSLYDQIEGVEPSPQFPHAMLPPVDAEERRRMRAFLGRWAGVTFDDSEAREVA